jgi:hypothetical protein
LVQNIRVTTAACLALQARYLAIIDSKRTLEGRTEVRDRDLRGNDARAVYTVIDEKTLKVERKFGFLGGGGIEDTSSDVRDVEAGVRFTGDE